MARPVRRSAATIAVVLAVVLSASCGAGDDAETVLAAWFDAVQSGDPLGLADVDASAPADRTRAGEGQPPTPFDAWAAGVTEVLARFEQERDEGRFTIDPRGYALVRAAGLGRGAFWQVERRGRREGRDELLVRINFGYGEIPYGSLPPGTTVYLLGHPPGTIHAIELGRGRRVQVDVLEHAYVRATLRRRGAGGEPGRGPAVEQLAWADRPPGHGVVDWIF